MKITASNVPSTSTLKDYINILVEHPEYYDSDPLASSVTYANGHADFMQNADDPTKFHLVLMDESKWNDESYMYEDDTYWGNEDLTDYNDNVLTADELYDVLVNLPGADIQNYYGLRQVFEDYPELEYSDTIESATDITDNIFMLMDYSCGYEGMESDCFECLGKFYADSLEDAQAELKQCISSNPNKDALGSLYVSEFNPYFDNFDDDNLLNYRRNEVFSDLTTLFNQVISDEPFDEEYADLPFASTDITASEDADSTEDDFDARWDATFGEPSGSVWTSDDILAWLKEVQDFE